MKRPVNTALSCCPLQSAALGDSSVSNCCILKWCDSLMMSKACCPNILTALLKCLSPKWLVTCESAHLWHKLTLC